MKAKQPRTEDKEIIEGNKSLFHPKTLKQKQHLWQNICLMHNDERILAITATISQHSQARLLEAATKNTLLNYCRYALLFISSNCRKNQFAEAFADNLRENPWLSMVLLPKAALELYLRLCLIETSQEVSIDLEKEAKAVNTLLSLGMADLALGAGKKDIYLELPADFKKSFRKFFENTQNFSQKSICAKYLSPELKAGTWKKVMQGYASLDCRIIMLLFRYGILTVEDLYGKLCACYKYQFNELEFKMYLMLRLNLLEMVHARQLLESRMWIAAPMDLNIFYAFKIQKAPVPVSEQRPVKREEIDTYGEWLSEQLEDLVHLLSNYTDDISLLRETSHQLTYAILENETWEDYLDILSDLLEDMEGPERICFWYELSKLYLHLPVAGLGGYSRMEYAEKEQLSNPYLILNDTENFLDHWEDKSIFGLPFEVQGELYLSAEHFVEDGTDLSEKRMLKYAKKHLSPELARALQIHCYLISGSPRLLNLLEREAKQGNMEAREMLERVEALLGEDED